MFVLQPPSQLDSGIPTKKIKKRGKNVSELSSHNSDCSDDLTNETSCIALKKKKKQTLDIVQFTNFCTL